MSPKPKCHQSWNVTKTEMSTKLKCPQNANVPKTDMTPKMKCHQKWNVTETEMSPKLKCHQNWNVTQTEMSQTKNFLKSKLESKWAWPWSPWSRFLSSCNGQVDNDKSRAKLRLKVCFNCSITTNLGPNKANKMVKI